MSTWYYVEGGERRGPIDHETLIGQLETGALPSNTLVWRDGMTDWVAASDAADLSAPAGMGPVDVTMSSAVGGYDPYAQDQFGVQYIAYAGFWKRFVAWFVDSIIMMMAGGCIQFMIGAMIGVAVGVNGGDLDTPNANMTFQLIGTLVGTIVGWLYYALFESSQYQATPGKMLIQIKVTDMSGGRISFARATGRYFAKFLSTFTLGIGYIMAGFTEKKQALHDMVAGCLVVNR